MNIFIPTKDRAASISTHSLFDKAMVIVHNREQAEQYLRCGMPHHRMIISNTAPDAYGLTRQREYITKRMTGRGEWFLFADDNIQELWAIPFPHYDEDTLVEIKNAMGTSALAATVNKYRPKGKRVMDPAFFLDYVVSECILVAEEVGAHMVGFSVTDNPLFCTSKWGTTSYVSGKLFLFQNTGMPWDHTITMEDFRNTAWHLATYGRVLINRYIHPRAAHYQAGGMGTPRERIPYRLRDIEKLMQEYPGLFRIKNAYGYPDLSIRLHGEKSIDTWRANLGTTT